MVTVGTMAPAGTFPGVHHGFLESVPGPGGALASDWPLEI